MKDEISVKVYLVKKLYHAWPGSNIIYISVDSISKASRNDISRDADRFKVKVSRRK